MVCVFSIPLQLLTCAAELSGEEHLVQVQCQAEQALANSRQSLQKMEKQPKGGMALQPE